MKNTTKILLMAVLLAMGITHSNAGGSASFITNIVVKSRMTFFATAFQAGDKQVRISTKDVLKEVANSLEITLDPKARFELVHILKSTDNFGSTTSLQGTWRIRLINGGATYDLSASNFAISGQNVFNLTADNIAVSAENGPRTNVRRILHVSLNANVLHIEADGATTINTTTTSSGKVAERLDCDFQGDGFSLNDENAVFLGGLDAHGNPPNNATEVIALNNG